MILETSLIGKELRVVVDLRRNVEPETVKRQLYKLTSIESSFGFNTLAIVDRKTKNTKFKRIYI